jgi:Helix-turn-helix.
VNSFAKNLKDIRTSAGISRKILAERLGVTERAVSYWEEGKRECGFDVLIKLSEYFDVTTDFLLGKREY